MLPEKVYYKLDGHDVRNCSFKDWMDYNVNRQREKDHIVKVDIICEDVTLSTVFVGIDMSMGKHHRPLLFETKIFGGPRDEQAYGSPSWKLAEVTHNIILQELKKEHEQTKGTSGPDSLGKDMPVL